MRSRRRRIFAEIGLQDGESPSYAVPPRRLDSVLDRLVQVTIGRHERLGLLQDLWGKIVGETLRDLCQPVRIAGPVLTVRAANDTVAGELILQREKILDRIRSLPDLGHLRSLRIFHRNGNGRD
jgi:hypothetical protein